MKLGENLNFDLFQALGLNLEIRSSPPTPKEGLVYYNTSLKRLCVSDGTKWDIYAIGDVLRFLGRNGVDISEAPANSYGLVYNFNAAENLVSGDICYLNGSGMNKADADATASSIGLLGVCMADVSTGESGLFLMKGYLQRGSGLTTGDIVWLSTTAGSLTQTSPSGSGQTKRILGYAISDNEIWFDPDKTYIVNT